MHDTAAMRVLYGFGELLHEFRSDEGRRRFGAFLKPAGEGNPRAVGGSDVTDRADLVGFVYGHDAGMVQACGGARLTVEALTQIGIYEGLPPRQFESDVTPQPRVEGEVDNAEAATAQFAAYFEPAEGTRFAGIG